MHRNLLGYFRTRSRLAIILFGSLLTGCQLLSPYQGPLTPTPDYWKTTYDAPDAGKPIVPVAWKTDNAKQGTSTFESNKLSSNTSENAKTDGQTESQVNANSDSKTPKEPEEPRFEDVCRDLCNWWEIFNDPILNELEEQALNSSYTLWAALERVIQARATSRINFSPLLPNINFDPAVFRSGILLGNPLSGIGTGTQSPCTSSCGSSSSSMTPAAAAATTATATPKMPKDFRLVGSEYLVPLTLAYEVDLWGQLHNAYFASLIRAQSASQAYLSVLLSLTADIASTYFQLRSLDTQQEVIMKNIKVRQNAVDINKARFGAGLIVYLDVSRAEVELARARADSDDVHRRRGLQENLLATLVGTPAPIFCLAANPVMVPPPVIPTGLPSELLCRRPDIAQAERDLAAAYYDIGVAYANFFPSVNLSAALGVASPFAHNLFSWHARFWEVGLSAMQSVFDAGRNQANYDYYKSRCREAMANYQEQVLQGFKDAEDALVNLRGYADQAQDLADAVKAAQLTLDLAQMRYMRGLINYLDVVDAERQLLETEQNSVIVLGNRYVGTVMLVRALGGGWGPCETSWENSGTCWEDNKPCE